MKQFLLYNCTVFDWDIDGRNQTCSNEQIGVWFSVEISFFLNFFGFHGLSGLSSKDRNHLFSMESFLKNVKISIETLRGDINSVLTETNMFENRKMTWNFFAISRISVLSFVWCKCHNEKLIQQNICHNSKVSTWGLSEKRSRLATIKQEFGYRVESFCLFFFGFWELQDLAWVNKNKGFQSNPQSQSWGVQ